MPAATIVELQGVGLEFPAVLVAVVVVRYWVFGVKPGMVQVRLVVVQVAGVPVVF